MASYDDYDRGYGRDRDREYSRRSYVREERRDDPRVYEREREYTRQYAPSSRDLVPRAREDSELSVEEVRREFPPPSARDMARRSRHDYYEDDYDRYDDRYDERYDDRRSRRGPGSVYHEEEEVRTKSKGMSTNEKIIAAVAGAALLAGGKELYDRKEAKDGHKHVERNALSSVALAGVGALAAYQGAEFYSKQQAKKDQKATYILQRGRDGDVREYYSDEEGDPKEKKSNKNFLESAIAATGLGAAMKQLTGGDKDKDKDDRSDTRSRAGDRDGDAKSGNANKIQKAAMASLLAGATEAFRVAKEPGSWKGEKAKRVFTAAAGAATIDSAQSGDHGKMGMAQSVIGGLVGNRLVNGSKNEIEEDKKTGRSRSRSRARSQGGGMNGATGLAALATAGLGAVGAKKYYDNYQESRSKSRGRSRSDSRGRGGSRSPSPQRRSRSRSVVDKARNGLAKLGIGAGAGATAGAITDGRERDDYSDRGSRRPSSRRRYSDEYDDDDYRSARGGARDGGRDRDDYYDDRSYRGSSRREPSRSRKGGYSSESDLGDSDQDEKEHRKMRGKQVLTSGLAAVATIHAAHGVYSSMQKRDQRHKAVKEGRLSPAEAKKLKTKAFMQDAASVGIAAMGIKGAIGEMKEAKELDHECKEFKTEKQRRHEKREERRKRALEANREDRRSDSTYSSRRRYDDGYESDSEDDYYGRRYTPRYNDGNPYGSSQMPPPVRSRA